MTIQPATREELPEALTLLYDVAPEDRPAYLAHAFRLMARGELDPADFWLARDAGHLIGVMALRELAGAAGIVWPPRTAPPHRQDVEDELMEAALSHLNRAKLLQTFLPPEQHELAGPLLRHGFTHVTDVIHLEHPGGLIAPPLEHLEIVSSPDVKSPEYRRLVMRCHDDSLDCPELNRHRTVDDLLTGYQDIAPERDGWRMAVWHGAPVGIAITSPGELSFIGLIPEVRGQGLGSVFLRQILDRMGSPCRLIVDERNTPAKRMYARMGFQATAARHVLLWFAE
ncbi:GNAT family N-acetyltransferase [Zavarzinella formosa]|uniref:GNAT family N-acetyltransferase n=1 Tax=Zavarzinella formosa TaxID=360055 RepID=UPI00031FC9D1|nr:GNAT family N-acetyltransferase [Zavarzinella formosa]